jgi:putative transposase
MWLRLSRISLRAARLDARSAIRAFKSKKRSRASFYLANDKFTVGDHWIDVPKLGRVNMAEKVRFSGNILSARISKTAAWWFVSITVEMPDDLPLNTYPPVGIDVEREPAGNPL